MHKMITLMYSILYVKVLAINIRFCLFCKMHKKISIPKADRDERIGSVFNHLFSVITENEGHNDKYVEWDFSNAFFFHPFFLFPLAIYKTKCSKNINCTGIESIMRSYLECVNFHDMLTINDEIDLEGALKEYSNKSYIPICRFSRLNKNIDSMQTIIQNVIEKQKKLDNRLKTPISYLISELICNIDQHSDSKYGYIYTQYLSRENSLDICIADDGITVYGSYVRTNKMLDVIGDNEAEALKLANEGYSTKDFPEAESRGFGISSSKDMIVNGLGGAFFMLSGGAFHRYDSESGCVYIKLPKTINWDGTIILMRIPLSVDEKFDYMKYIR